MTLPQDSIMLLSVINTYLRDRYPSLEALCEGENINQAELVEKLAAIEYIYMPEANQFK